MVSYFYCNNCVLYNVTVLFKTSTLSQLEEWGLCDVMFGGSVDLVIEDQNQNSGLSLRNVVQKKLDSDTKLFARI